MIVDLRTYTMVPCPVGAWLASCETGVMPIRERYLGKPIDVLTIETRTLDELMFIFANQDQADHECRSNAFEADPDWVAYRRKSAESGNVQQQENKIIRPIALSQL